MILRYLDGPHRPGEVAPRTHPVPEHIEVVPLGLREPVNAEAVHSWGAAILSNLHPRLQDEALGNVKRLHRLPWLLHQLLPRRVDLKMTWPARSLRSRPITGPSSLLRTAPSLCLASVLSPLRCSTLGVLPLAASDKFYHWYSTGFVLATFYVTITPPFMDTRRRLRPTPTLWSVGR